MRRMTAILCRKRYCQWNKALSEDNGFQLPHKCQRKAKAGVFKAKGREQCDPQFPHNKTINPSGLLMTFSNVSILGGATRIGFQDEFLSRWQPWRGPDARKQRLDMFLSLAPLSQMRGNWDYFSDFLWSQLQGTSVWAGSGEVLKIDNLEVVPTSPLPRV